MAALLLDRAGLRPASRSRHLSRVADQAVARDPETGCRRRQVFGRPDHLVGIVRVELPAGARGSLPATRTGVASQLVWVLAGELVVVADGERHALTAGDCLSLLAPPLPTFDNQGLLPCTFAVLAARTR